MDIILKGKRLKHDHRQTYIGVTLGCMFIYKPHLQNVRATVGGCGVAPPPLHFHTKIVVICVAVVIDLVVTSSFKQCVFACVEWCGYLNKDQFSQDCLAEAAPTP